MAASFRSLASFPQGMSVQFPDSLEDALSADRRPRVAHRLGQLPTNFVKTQVPCVFPILPHPERLTDDFAVRGVRSLRDFGAHQLCESHRQCNAELFGGIHLHSPW